MKDDFLKMNEDDEKELSDLEKRLLVHYRKAFKETKEILFMIEEEYRNNGELKPSEIFRYNRMQQLRNQLLLILQRLNNEEYEITEKALVDLYVNNYLKSAYILEGTLGMELDVQRIDQEIVKIAATTYMSGITVKEMMDEKTVRFLNELQNEITQGFILNESYRDMSKRLQNRFNMKVENSRRLVRSEGTRIQTIARNESYKLASEKGISLKKEWISSLDSRTRKTHRKLDGQKVGVDDYFSIGRHKALGPGQFGIPSEDYNCRCTIAAVIDEEEIMLRRDTNKNIFKDMSYEEWERKYK